MAVVVKGEVIMRRESLVVWALIREAESWARERGLIAGVESSLGFGPVGGVVVWSCVRRWESVETVDFNVARSRSTLLIESGILETVMFCSS
jgi:hypothetical protein